MFLALCTIETLFVNMVITHICSKKKYSKAKTIILITLLTVIVTLLLAFLKYILLDHKITVLCIIGFVYILPLMYVYDEKMDKLIIIMCFTWTYTTLFKTLSFELVNTINVGDIYKSAFIIQTIMYSILTPFLICFIKERFIYLIQKVSDNELIYLKCISIMWFGTAILLDKVYSGNLNIYYKILFIICLVINSILTYNIMYRLSIFYKNIVNLEKIAYKDKLTGVKNRAAIFKEIPSIMKKKSNFKIIFLDLDKFKLINDTFGHDMGDKYLIQFANKCEEIIEHKGEIYRIGGDEFVIIIDSDSTDDCLDKIEQLHWEMFELRIHFKGVSIGIASYPEDGQSIEELIFVADRKMYRDKRQRQDCCK